MTKHCGRDAGEQGSVLENFAAWCLQGTPLLDSWSHMLPLLHSCFRTSSASSRALQF